tara:strand:- start:284 stop:2743 length:2460 start_codon:yes stop_codon:yes gene_type:complete
MSEKKYSKKEMEYSEGWNLHNCKYWVLQPYEKWVESFGLSEAGDNKEDRDISGNKRPMTDKEWVDWIKRELMKIVDKRQHSRLVQYKYSKKNQAGRRYVVGFGLQNISKEMRPYFYKNKAHEVDISNCFPCLTFYMFRDARDGEGKLPLKRLEWYLKNRKQAHTKWEIDKKTFNTFLNRDNPNFHGYHSEFRSTIEEIHARRQQYFLRNKEAMEICKAKKKAGSKNPFASTMFHLLERQEEKIRNKMVEIITDGDVSNRYDMVLQHDGIYFTYPVEQEHINKINNWLAHDQKKPLITATWTPANEFHLEDCPTIEYSKDQIYDEKASHFWSNKFRISNFTGEGGFGWVVISVNKATGVRTICSKITKKDLEEYTLGFGVEWEKEERDKLFSGEHLERATFTDLTWRPYNNLQGNCLEGKDCFNLYIPDQAKYIDVEHRSPLAINLFHKLCKALTHDEWTEHMLIGRIAFMYQQPHIPDQSIFVLKGLEGGVGKDTLMKLMRKVFHLTDGKRYGNNVSLSGYLGDGTENEVREQLFVWFNETSGKDGHKYMDLLKEATTKDYLDKKAKYVSSIKIKNVVRTFVLSNNHTPLKPDRRVCLCQVRTVGEDMIQDSEYQDLYNKVMDNRDELDSLFSHLIDWATPDDIVEKYSEMKVQSFPYDGKFNYKYSPSQLQQANEEKTCFPIDKLFIRLATEDWSSEVNGIYGHIRGANSKLLCIQKKPLINLLKKYIEGDIEVDEDGPNPLDDGLTDLEEDFSILQNKPDLYNKCKDFVNKWRTEYHDQIINQSGSYNKTDGTRITKCWTINLSTLLDTYKRQGKYN